MTPSSPHHNDDVLPPSDRAALNVTVAMAVHIVATLQLPWQFNKGAHSACTEFAVCGTLRVAVSCSVCALWFCTRWVIYVLPLAPQYQFN